MLRLFFVLTVSMVLMCPALYAQDEDTTQTGWQKSLTIDFTTTQTSYSDSWVGGEAGSVNWVGNLNASASKALNSWLDFQSKLKLSFGQTLTQTTDDLGDKHWSKPKKSTDLIDWENVASFAHEKLVDPYIALRIESQFQDASNEAKKLYLNPIKITESAGLIHKLYEQDKSFVLSRLGFGLQQILKRTAVAIDDGFEVNDSTFVYYGLESVTDAEFMLADNLKYTGKLGLYKAFYFSKKDEADNDYWKAVDVNWENIISASITKVITVNLYTQLLYDKEVSKKGRFKETLAIGFVLKMM